MSELKYSHNRSVFETCHQPLIICRHSTSYSDIHFSSQVRVLLVSLMADNVGLNLTAASHVIIHGGTLLWRTRQLAEHRIGQTRPLTVHRLVVEDTIEKRVLHLQVRSSDNFISELNIYLSFH
jgi:SNF2 family DNA or RNA helicase